MSPYYETFYPPFFMERRYAYNAIAVNPRGYDRHDSDIVCDLKLRLISLAPLDTSRVVISCEKNIVTITGHAASKDAVIFLGKVADRILGVRAVHNSLQVYRAGASARDTFAPNQRQVAPDTIDPKPVDEFLI